MLEVSLLGVGTLLRLQRGAWSRVKWIRQATNEYAPPPSPLPSPPLSLLPHPPLVPSLSPPPHPSAPPLPLSSLSLPTLRSIVPVPSIAAIDKVHIVTVSLKVFSIAVFSAEPSLCRRFCSQQPSGQVLVTGRVYFFPHLPPVLAFVFVAGHRQRSPSASPCLISIAHIAFPTAIRFGRIWPTRTFILSATEEGS